MLRKTILAGAAALTLGAAALAPTSASAWWGGHPGWHGLHHGWFYRPAVRASASCAGWSGRLMARRRAGSMFATDDAVAAHSANALPKAGAFALVA